MAEHGTYAMYVTAKCRCDACKDASVAYQRQRERADRARALHTETVRLQAQADAARAKRDAHIAALLAEGVRPFVVQNETGCPAGVVERVARGMR